MISTPESIVVEAVLPSAGTDRVLMDMRTPTHAPHPFLTARTAPDGSWFPEKTDTFQTMIRAAKGVRDVLQAGTPVLREAAKPIKEEDIGTPQIQARWAGRPRAATRPRPLTNRPKADIACASFQFDTIPVTLTDGKRPMTSESMPPLFLPPRSSSRR